MLVEVQLGFLTRPRAEAIAKELLAGTEDRSLSGRDDPTFRSGAGFCYALVNTYEGMTKLGKWKLDGRLETLLRTFSTDDFYDSTGIFSGVRKAKPTSLRYEGSAYVQFFNEAETEILVSFFKMLIDENLTWIKYGQRKGCILLKKPKDSELHESMLQEKTERLFRERYEIKEEGYAFKLPVGSKARPYEMDLMPLHGQEGWYVTILAGGKPTKIRLKDGDERYTLTNVGGNAVKVRVTDRKTGKLLEYPIWSVRKDIMKGIRDEAYDALLNEANPHRGKTRLDEDDLNDDFKSELETFIERYSRGQIMYRYFD